MIKCIYHKYKQDKHKFKEISEFTNFNPTPVTQHTNHMQLISFFFSFYLIEASKQMACLINLLV